MLPRMRPSLQRALAAGMLSAFVLAGCASSSTHTAATATAALPSPTRPDPTPECSAVSTPTSAVTHTPVPSATPVAATHTPARSPASTATSSAAPTIAYFRALVQEADPGQEVVLEWRSSGASMALLYALPASGQLPLSGWNVAPSGSYTCSIAPDLRNSAQFMLWVQDDTGRGASAHLSIKLRCPETWFFSPAPDGCASAVLPSNAAQQRFQHGRMLWVEARQVIIVLYDDAPRTPRWDMFADEWTEGQPQSDASIATPTGLYQPVRGFGLVWRGQPLVRERLGWAVESEAGFQTLWQTTTLFKYNSIYLRGPDGNVWHLGPERSSWELIEVVLG